MEVPLVLAIFTRQSAAPLRSGHSTLHFFQVAIWITPEAFRGGHGLDLELPRGVEERQHTTVDAVR
jgi:hypothetical protein